ncbi:MAG: Lrp/AsnC ligand binding domain-containing protein [Candidatus Bathyarchaeota archaeon]|nr:MAG: Lrp/AsnC ligand binding domain-containing protein [Candidatus Bathyarchaeota archaeon]
MGDGRMSFQQIAKSASVSTPTVQSRVRRLINTGVIKKIAPILDLEKIEEHVLAVVEVKVEASSLSDVLDKLADLEEVRNVYATTGEYNVLFSVVSDSIRALQDFLTDRISTIPGISSLSYRVVTRIAKDDPGVPLRPGLGIRLTCDECGKEILGEPDIMKVGEGTRYFCCKTCLARYKEKYGSRLQRLQESGTL